MNVEMNTFYEPYLLPKIRMLDREGRGVFAVSCLDFLLPSADAYAASVEGVRRFISGYPVIVKALLATSITEVDVVALSAQAEELIPGEDDANPFAAYADDWLAACAYSFPAVTDEAGQEMLCVARRCYDAVDRAAASLLDVTVYKEDQLLRHHLVQGELSRQQEALRELGTASPSDVLYDRIREQAHQRGVALRDAIARNISLI